MWGRVGLLRFKQKIVLGADNVVITEEVFRGSDIEFMGPVESRFTRHPDAKHIV